MLAAGCSGWLLKKATIIERVLLIAGALMFVYPNRLSDVLGFACLIAVLLLQKVRKDKEALEPRTV